MKSTRNILFILIIGLIAAGQIYYLMTPYKADKDQISANKSQIEATQMRINQLEERLKKHEQSKKELAQIQVEQKAMVEKIPDQRTKSEFASNFMDYLKVFDCLNPVLSAGGTQVITSDIGDLYKAEYSLQFISTYASSKQLMGDLKRMYQTCNVMSYSFNNSVQQGQGKDNWIYPLLFGEELSSVGQTTIAFNVYYRMTGEPGDEIYHSEYLGKVNATPFKNLKAVPEQEKSEQPSEEGSSDNGQSPSQDFIEIEQADFILNIGDMLTSGDVYKLSGPGDDPGSYIGLNSRASVEITVSVDEESYTLSIKDKEGKMQESKVQYKVESPNFRIISTMRQLEEVMPSVHIYINNETSEKMNVSLSGTLLDHIHLYDGKKNEIEKGQTRGNISLT